MAEFYLWFLAAHITAVILFVAGIVLTAFFLSAADAQNGLALDDAQLRALARWDRRVTTPAMLLVWIFGFALVEIGDWFPQPWLIMKLAFVTVLSALHGIQSGKLRRLQRQSLSLPPHKYVDTVIIGCVIAIIFLVVLKPA